jgi:hypothetical protein
VYVTRDFDPGLWEPVGTTPYSFPLVLGEQIKVVWPDGVESDHNWQNDPEFPRQFHFVKPVFSKPIEDYQTNVTTKQSGQVNAPWGPIHVVSYTFDARTQKGSLSVDISERGFEVRDWVVKNIGKICSTQNIGLEAGKEPTTGGRYKILNESVKSSILTIEFEALY